MRDTETVPLITPDPSAGGLYLIAAAHGQGVATTRPLEAGVRVLRFRGEHFDRSDIEKQAAAGAADGFLQIDEDAFLGLSGGLDDFVNHSCEPNCRMEIDGSDVFLWTVRRIGANEELTFDYATTQSQFPFRFYCNCRTQSCRGEIGNYDEIPINTQQRYLSKQMFAPYIVASIGFLS